MKTGYVCKYTPVELLEAMGAGPVRIDPEVTNFNEADTRMHPNMCSYTKGVLETYVNGDYDGLVLTTCCDSVRRLCDVLKDLYPGKFIFLLDVPRKTDGHAAALYAGQLRGLVSALETYTGRKYEEGELRRILSAQWKAEEDTPGGYETQQQGTVSVGIVGARCPRSLYRELDRKDVHVQFDLTCTGMERGQSLWQGAGRPEEILRAASEGCGACGEAEGLLPAYAAVLLGQLPCMRMADSRARADFLDAHSSGLDGVICHTVKFCDSYSFEYEKLRRENRIQLLKLETDLTAQCEGQISTRVEAFIESLHAQKDGTGENGGEDTGRGPASAESGTGSARGSADTAQGGTGAARKENGMDRIIVMGIDSGSTSTNGVIMDGTGRILAAGSVRTGAGTIDSSAAIREQLLQEAGLTQADILRTVATGYGRAAIPFAGGSVTEISCHARGARYFDPHVMTILDIGGQDSKAIRLNEKGEVTDFVMNDKCAAGTGRFLEAMARTLEVEIGELGPISLQSTEEVEISSMCTVFAESEVISLIAQNKKKADIAHGVHRAIAGKAVALLNRVDPAPAYMMTGGVARNPGVVKAVEEKLHAELFICEQPDIVGAVGAALCALDAAK